MSWQRAVGPGRAVRPLRHQWATFGAMAVSSLACISTEVEFVAPFPVCRSISSGGGGLDAVVQLVTNRRASVLPCTGVVIAPKLVLTASACVEEASDPLQSDPTDVVEPTVAPEGSEVDPAGVRDYSAICDREADWALRERGNFGGRPGESVSPASIDVYRLPLGADASDPDSYQIVKVSRVFTSRSTSRCRDDISVLQLEEPLDVVPITLWLGGGVAVGEPVTLANYCADRAGPSVVLETPSQVLAITRDGAQPALPPRSLLLTGQLASSAPGGAVFSGSSNSLLGMIVSGTADYCDTQSTGGTTIATHLAAFHGLLFDAASAAQQVLPLDPDADDPYDRNVSDCSEP